MLKEISDKLNVLQNEKPEVFGVNATYGRVTNQEAPEIWNYIVYNRKDTKKTGSSNCDYTEYFEIHLVHEDFVPENAVYELIQTLTQIKGLKQSNDDIAYDYAIKNGSNVVVEMATVTFCRAVKGYKVIG